MGKYFCSRAKAIFFVVLVTAFLLAAACAQPAAILSGPASCTPVLSVKPDKLTFKLPPVSAVSEQSISIINAGTGDLNWVISDDSPWLTEEQGTGTSTSAGTLVRVRVDATGMKPGDYTGIISIASEGALNNNVYIPVYVSIASPGGPQAAAAPQPEQTMAPSLAVTAPRPSTSDTPPVDAIYWNNSSNSLYRYANSSACIVSGSIQNLDKIWYLGDVRVVTAAGPSAYIIDSIAPGETASYYRFIPCFDQQSIRLSYHWYRP